MTGSLHTSVGGSSCRSTVNLPCALTCRCIPPSLLAQAAQGVIIEVLVISVCSAESCSSVAMSLHLVKGRLLSQLLCRQASGGCKQAQDRAAGIRAISQAAGRVDEPWVTATPRVCLHDVPTTLRAGGLSPHTPVTLAANLTDENGKEFASHAHYVTDEQGTVDVTTAAAVSGSYKGVFPAGLLTTLAPAPHEYPYLRLYRRDPSSPWKITLRLLDGHQPLEMKTKSLAEVKLERHLMAPGVQRRPVREGRVRGTLYLPAGEGPFPGVIDMFGAIGGLIDHRAAMLASRGIATLALAFFAYDDLPSTTDYFELEYFEEAIGVLLGQAGVVPDRCGVVATSKAVDIACCMATYLTQVKALVSISGSPYPFDSIVTYRGQTLTEGFKMEKNFMKADQEGKLHLKKDLLEQLSQAEHYPFVPIEQADDETHFLMVVGEDDALSINIFVNLARQHMDTRGRGAWLETVEYPGAGHILDPPYAAHVPYTYQRYLPVVAEDGSSKVSKVIVMLGGHARDQCRAQEDLWPRMRAFLTRHVRDNSPWYKQHCQVLQPLITSDVVL